MTYSGISIIYQGKFPTNFIEEIHIEIDIDEQGSRYTNLYSFSYRLFIKENFQRILSKRYTSRSISTNKDRDIRIFIHSRQLLFRVNLNGKRSSLSCETLNKNVAFIRNISFSPFFSNVIILL